MRKKKKMQAALELAKAVHEIAPAEAGLLEAALRGEKPKKLGAALAAEAVKKLNTPKTRRLIAVAGGAVAVSTVAHGVSRRRFYRSAVAKEMKKQLAPLQEQIAELQKSVDALRAETAPELHRKHGK